MTAKIMFGGIAAAIMLAGASAGSATTVTFTPLTDVNQGEAGSNGFYQESGLDFTSSLAIPGALYHWGTSQSFDADPTGATLFQNYPAQSLIVMRTGGGAFTLNSFDLADVYNTGAASVIPFTYVDGGGSHSSTLTLDNLVGLQTFTFNLPGVTSFTLEQDPAFFQIDNIVYNGVSVPEPATWALMLSGFGGLGLALRSRRKVAIRTV